MHHSPKENLITTKDASELSGYTSDYLARLVRSGEIQGKRIGHSWTIDSASLEVFMSKQKSRKLDRARELASSRVREYNKHNQFVQRTARALTEKVSVPQFVFENVSLRSHAFALSIALAVVAVGAVGAHAAAVPHLAQRASALATEISSGFVDTFGDVPARIEARMEEARVAVRADATRSALASRRAGYVASPSLASINLETLRSVLVKEYRAPYATSGIALSSSRADTQILTVTDVYASVARAYELLAHPSSISTALTDAYLAIGTDAYAAVDASFSAYRALVDDSGVATLAAAATTRDAFSRAPHLVTQVNLALGEAVIGVTHAAIHADVIAAHGLAAAAPASARVAVTLMGSVGDTLARATEQVPARVATAYLGATAAPATLAPQLAQAILKTEYEAASRFVTATGAVADRYLALVEGAGDLAYESVGKARAVSGATMRSLALAPAVTEDALLGALGKSAVALDSATHLSSFAPMLAAALPALSASERAALAVYEAIHSAFDSANRSLVAFFTTTPPTVLPTGVPKARIIGVATSTRSVSSGTQSGSTVSYPTYTTVVRGVSEDFMNQSLASLRTNVLATVAGMIQPVSNQVVQNITTIQQLNRIDSLHDLVVQNGDFRNSIFDSGIRVSATDGSFSRLSAGTTTLATTTINGTLTISSLTLTGSLSTPGAITGSYFVSTSTNATSTLAGSLNIDNAGFVYATTTRNVGIGVLSPAALLAVQNSSASQPIFVASNAAGAEVYRLTNAGFVGIGTTSPTYNLAVEGSSTLGNQAIAGYFTATTTTATSTFAGSLAVGTTSPTGNGLFTVGTSTPLLFVSNTTGFVGIGTTSPFAALSVAGNGFFNGNLTASNVTATGTLAVSGLASFALASTSQLSVFDRAWFGGSATSTFTSNGYLGILNSAPAYPLDVTGAGRFSSLVDASHFVATSSTATSTFAGGLAVGTSKFVVDSTTGSIGIGTTTPTALVSGQSPTLHIAGTLNPEFRLERTTGASHADASLRVTDNKDFVIAVKDGTASTIDALAILSDSGNVGIGTTAPGGRLEIKSSGVGTWIEKYTNSAGTYVGGLYETAASHGQWYLADSAGTDKVVISANSGQATYFNHGGNVGIGTTSPSTLLHLYGANSLLRLDGASATNIVQGFFRNNTEKVSLGLAGSTNAIITGSVLDDFAVRTSGNILLSADSGTTAHVAVTTAGKVGIGTTTPAGKLTVASSGGANSGLTFDNNNAASYAPIDFTQNSVLASQITSSGSGFSSGAFGSDELTIAQEQTSGTLHLAAIGASGIIKFTTGANSTANERLRITAAGNVGIGTTSPADLFDVYDSSGTGKGLVISTSRNTGGANRNWRIAPDNSVEGTLDITPSTALGGHTFSTPAVSISNGGNVGVGTANPQSKLNIVPGNGVEGVRVSGTSNTLGLSLAYTDAGTTHAYISNLYGGNAASDMQFQFGSTLGSGTVMTLLQSGNVGIGSTTPGYKLAVAGSAYFDGGTVIASGFTATSSISAPYFTATSASATSTFAGGLAVETSGLVYDYSTNNVGIGTASPLKLLHVGAGTDTPSIDAPLYIAGANDVTKQGVVIRDSTNDVEAYWRVYPAGTSQIGTYTNHDFTLAANGAEAVRVQSGGNVGIGTTTPDNPLTVISGDANGIRINATATNRPSLLFGNLTTGLLTQQTVTNTADWQLDVGAGAGVRAIEAKANGNVLLSQSAGNVGIGTTSPASKLDIATVNDSTSEYGTLRLGVVNSTANELYTIGRRSTDGFLSFRGWQSGASGYHFSNNISGTDTEVLTILNSGNVGIGTTAPGNKLAVVTSSGDDTIPALGSNGGKFALLDGGGAGAYGLIAGVLNTGNVFMQAQRVDGTATAYNLLLQPSGGNVGIGTTAPGRLLTVNGILGFQSSGTETGYIQSDATHLYVDANNAGDNVILAGLVSGNVGIGTTTPGQKLDVSPTTNGDGIVINAIGGSAAPALKFRTDSAATSDYRDWALVTNYSPNGSLDFQVGSARGVNPYGGTQVMTLTKEGNVGIGATAPSRTLDIEYNAGGVNTAGLQITNTASGGNSWGVVSAATGDLNAAAGSLYFRDDTSGGAKFVIQTDGNVGIGATSPSSLLDVRAVNGLPVAWVGYTGAGTANTGNLGLGLSWVNGAVMSYSGSTAVTTISNVYSGTVSGLAYGDIAFTSFAGGGTATTTNLTIKGYSGNIGIGTTSPTGYYFNTATILDISGANAAAIRLERTGATVRNWEVGLTTGGNFDIVDTVASLTTPRMRIDTSGNVGIGTASPSYLLDVEQSSDSQNALFAIGNVNTGTAAQTRMCFGNNTSPCAGQINYTGGNFTGANNVMTVTNANNGYLLLNPTGGNVGIGTTAPGAKLDVGTGGLRVTAAGSDTYASGGYIQLSNTASAQAALQINASGNLGFWTDNGGLGWVQKMVLTNGGNVGIGTTNPQALLDVTIPYAKTDTTRRRVMELGKSNDATNYSAIQISATGAAAAANRTWDFQTIDQGLANAGNIAFQVDGGNVGIGTTTPGQKLDVSPTTNGDGIVINAIGGSAAPALKFRTDSAATSDYRDWALVTNYSPNGSLDFQVGSARGVNPYGGTQVMTLTKEGNVGIGDTTPVAKLSVAGGTDTGPSATVKGMLQIGGSSLAQGLVIGSYTASPFASYIQGLDNRSGGATTYPIALNPIGGNVGIGTTSPASVFTVSAAAGTANSTTQSMLIDGAGGQSALTLNSGGTAHYTYQTFAQGGTGKLEMGVTGSGDSAGGGVFYMNQNIQTGSTGATFVIKSGNVGIGTTNPQAKLSLVGGSTLRFGNDGDSGENLLYLRGGTTGDKATIRLNHYGYADWEIAAGWAGDGKFSITNTQGGTDGIVIDTAGNVGIGTTTPANILHTYAASTGPRFDLTGASDNNTLVLNQRNGYLAGGRNMIQFAQGTTPSTNMRFGFDYDSTALQIRSSADAALVTFANGGNVGIGTTSPAADFELARATNAELRVSATDGLNDRAAKLSLRGSGNGGALLGGAIIDFTDTDGTPATPGSLTFQKSGSSYLTILDGGNVGIGTTAPGMPLEVVENSGRFAEQFIAYGALAHGITDYGFKTNSFGGFMSDGVATGGLTEWGYSDGTTNGLRLIAALGSADPVDTIAAIKFDAYKKSGTAVAALGNLETVLQATNGGSALLTILGSGNVGIGTTGPESALTISGTTMAGSPTVAGIHAGLNSGTVATMQFYASNGGIIDFSDASGEDADWRIQSTATNLVLGAATSANGLAIDTSGKVGIGTTSPSYKLEVNNDSAATIARFFRNQTGSNADVEFGNKSNTWIQRVTGDGTYDYTLVNAGSGARVLTALYSGNVGIGTTGPGSKLSVAGAIDVTDGSKILLDGSSGITYIQETNGLNLVAGASRSINLAGGDGTDMTITSGGNVGIGTTSPGMLLSLESGGAGQTGIALSDITGGKEWRTRVIGNGSSRNGNFSIQNFSDGLNVLEIDTVGNVGIGTTSPSKMLTIGSGTSAAKLHIGSTNQQGIISFREASGAYGLDIGMNAATGNIMFDRVVNNVVTNVISIDRDTNGNVGIGTTAPGNKLSVAGHVSLTAGSFLGFTGDTALTSENYALYGFGGSVQINAGTGSTIDFRVNNAAKMTMDTNGNLGIGTTSPWKTLSVVGQVYTAAGSADGTSNAHGVVINNTGWGSGAGLWKIVSKNDVAGLAFYGNTSSASDFSSSVIPLFLEYSTGSVGISMTDPSVALDVTGDIEYTGTITDVSDERLKENFAPLTNNLENFAQLNPISYNMIGETRLQMGFTAQNVQTVFPSAVSVIDPATGYLGLDYTQLISPAIGAIRELDARTKFISNAATSTVLTVDALGNVGIGTTTPTRTLSVAGDIGAIAFVNTSTRSAKTDIDYATASSSEDRLSQLVALKVATYRYTIEDQNDPLRLGLIAEDTQAIAPEILSADGKGVDIYELATFTLSGVQALAAKVDAQETRMISLENRMTALESGAVSSASGSPITFSTSSLASALEGFGVLIRDGIAQFNTLVFRQLVASRDADGTSSAGSVTIIGGNTVAQVTNSLVQPSTKVFVTFNSSVTGSWWVSDKTNGSFRVVLSAPQAGDVSFDYFLVQTEGQIATSTQAVSSGTTSPSSSGLDTTAPVITLLGDNPLHLSIGGTFVEPGVTVTDNADASVPYVTFVNGVELQATAESISTSAQTTYIITYSATDARGNLATATRSVIVGSTTAAPSDMGSTTPVASADTTAPVVTLVGEAATQLTVGDTFTDSGATATDDTDGDVTASIAVSGTVDTATEGLYTLTYTATDAAGNTGSVSRVVTVVAVAAPVI